MQDEVKEEIKTEAKTEAKAEAKTEAKTEAVKPAPRQSSRPSRPKKNKHNRSQGKKDNTSTKKPAKKKEKRVKSGKKAAKEKRGKRYSPEQQKSLIKKYHKLRNAGMNAQDAAKKVGITYITLLKWEKKSCNTAPARRGRPPKKNMTSSKAPKQTTSTKSRKQTTLTGGIVLVTPKGYRIENITPEQLIKVLQELR